MSDPHPPGLVEALSLIDAVLAICCDPDGRVCIRGSEGDRAVLQAALDAARATPVPAQAEGKPFYPHTWDRDGERCTVCGDKDWMGGSCKPPATTSRADAVGRSVDPDLMSAIRSVLKFATFDHTGRCTGLSGQMMDEAMPKLWRAVNQGAKP